MQILLTQGQSTFLGYRFLGYYDIRWAFMGLLSELVNGFILTDFCYYYLTLYVTCFNFANFLIIFFYFPRKHIFIVSPLNAAILILIQSLMTCVSHHVWCELGMHKKVSVYIQFSSKKKKTTT